MIRFAAIIVSALALLGFTVGPLRAAAVHEFHDAVADASGHYREAVFYLRTGNPAVASFELVQARDKWRGLVDRFADSPPDIYADDPSWRETLETIDAAIAGGLAAAEKGDLEAATERLAPVRETLSLLRRRNGVFLFADCVDRANAAMDALFRFRHRPPDFARVEEVDALRRATAVAAHWYARCRDEAPAAIRDDPQFERLMGSSLESFAQIWEKIRAADTLGLVNILRALRSSDRLLYLRFG